MSTQDTGGPATVRFGRRPARGVLLGLSAPRAVALGCYAAVSITALTLAGVTGLVVALVVCSPLAAAAFTRFGGLPVADWVPVAAHYAARSAAGQQRYLARPHSSRPAGTLALPGDAAALRLHTDQASGAAMIFDPHRRTLAAVLPVSYPAFALLDDGERAGRVGRWGRVLAQVASSGYCAAVQVTEATVPDPGTGQRDWWAKHGRPGGGWAAAQYEDLLAAVRLDAAVHRATITYTLDLKAAARQIRAAGPGLTGAAVVLRGEVAGLTDALATAGLRAGTPLGEADLAAVIRQAFDPAVTVDARTSPGANLAHAGPLALGEEWDRLRHDSGWSRVLWVSEWPRIEVPADFLHPLLFVPSVRRVVSVTARPAGTADALRAIRKEKTEAAADAAHKARLGQIADLSDAAEYEDLLAREKAVISGHTDVAFTGLVTVTAPGTGDLDAATAALSRAATQGASELRVLYGRQAQGFICGALPLGRRPF